MQTILSREAIPEAICFAGHAIVSADGCIAAADGSMPPALRSEADWRHFQAALDLSAVVALGRLGHQRHHNPGRRRLVFTSTVASLAADAADPRALLFNPAGATLAEALAWFGIAEGIVAITGGRRVFEAFLPLYDAFDLAECNDLTMTGGISCFGAGHPRSILAGVGLHPLGFEMLDREAKVSLTRWTKPA